MEKRGKARRPNPGVSSARRGQARPEEDELLRQWEAAQRTVGFGGRKVTADWTRGVLVKSKNRLLRAKAMETF